MGNMRLSRHLKMHSKSKPKVFDSDVVMSRLFNLFTPQGDIMNGIKDAIFGKEYDSPNYEVVAVHETSQGPVICI